MPEQDVLQQFKVKTKVETIEGVNFTIRKMELLDFVGTDFFNIPLVKKAVEGKLGSTSQEERRKDILSYLLANRDTIKQAEDQALIHGVVKVEKDGQEIRLGNLDQYDSEFKHDLANRIMAFSGFGKLSEDFFRKVPSGARTPAGPGSPKIRETSE